MNTNVMQETAQSVLRKDKKTVVEVVVEAKREGTYREKIFENWLRTRTFQPGDTDRLEKMFAGSALN